MKLNDKFGLCDLFATQVRPSFANITVTAPV